MNSDSIDSLLPPAMARRAEETGVKKAGAGALNLLGLAVLAGAFIAVGAVFATVMSAGSSGLLSYGVMKLLSGLAFSTGLIMVVVGGAELFTGNNLIVMAYAARRVSLRALLRNWILVYLGNLVGAVLTAGLVYAGQLYRQGGGAVGLAMLNTAEGKAGLGFIQALALGILCNALVCMAVWLTYSARTTGDKILAIVPPITAFVAAGFEHSVANMYFIPAALLVKFGAGADFFALIGKTPADFPNLSLAGFFSNLLPVTLGNIIGGAGLVGLVYWSLYLRGRPPAHGPHEKTAVEGDFPAGKNRERLN